MESLWIGVIIVGCIVLIGLGDWIGEEYDKYKARKKKIASKTIDGAWLVYDSKGHIKKLGRELRELTHRDRRG